MNIEIAVLMNIAIMHFVAVASPGPDFAVVLKQAMQKGLKAAIWTSIGIGAGILLHVAYSILGISILIKTTPWLYKGMLYLAAAYLIWIAINALKSQAKNATDSNIVNMEGNLSTKIPQKYYKAFAIGFLTNALNPKATLFFLALFTTAIPASSNLYTKAAYGLYLSIATAIWFCALSLLTQYPPISKGYQSHGYYFDRLMGVVLIFMAICLVLKG